MALGLADAELFSDMGEPGPPLSNSIYTPTVYGTFVRAVREARALTQRELADVSGVRQSNISAIERGRRIPSADTLNRLVVACGFELAAVAGDRAVHCALPKAGWFPDEDLPEPLPSDPPDEAESLPPNASMDERVRVITALLEAADATIRG